MKTYPDYYKTTIIKYKDTNNNIVENLAWLAVDDDINYIWTLANDNTTIINNSQVISWKYPENY